MEAHQIEVRGDVHASVQLEERLPPPYCRLGAGAGALFVLHLGRFASPQQPLD